MLLPSRTGGAELGTVVPVGLFVGEMVEFGVGMGNWLLCTLEKALVAVECASAGLVAVVWR